MCQGQFPEGPVEVPQNFFQRHFPTGLDEALQRCQIHFPKAQNKVLQQKRGFTLFATECNWVPEGANNGFLLVRAASKSKISSKPMPQHSFGIGQWGQCRGGVRSCSRVRTSPHRPFVAQKIHAVASATCKCCEWNSSCNSNWPNDIKHGWLLVSAH